MRNRWPPLWKPLMLGNLIFTRGYVYVPRVCAPLRGHLYPPTDPPQEVSGEEGARQSPVTQQGGTPP